MYTRKQITLQAISDARESEARLTQKIENATQREKELGLVAKWKRQRAGQRANITKLTKEIKPAFTVGWDEAICPGCGLRTPAPNKIRNGETYRCQRCGVLWAAEVKTAYTLTEIPGEADNE